MLNFSFQSNPERSNQAYKADNAYTSNIVEELSKDKLKSIITKIDG